MAEYQVHIEELIAESVAKERRADEKASFRNRRDAAGEALKAKRAAVEARAAERRAAANPAQDTEGGNGGPDLETPPTFEALERIGEAAFGELWEAKLGAAIGEPDRTMRRFRAGEMATTPRAVAQARLWAIEHAAALLHAAGETDLAGEVDAHLQAMRLRSEERARAVHAANVARAAAAKAKG